MNHEINTVTYSLEQFRNIVFGSTSYHFSDAELAWEHEKGTCPYDLAEEGNDLLDDALFGEG
jgi:hypothetical protein